MSSSLVRSAVRRRVSGAAAIARWRGFASDGGSPTLPERKVAILGAAGGIGQPLSLLMKLNPLVSSVSLYDIAGTPGVAADVSHVNTRAQVKGYAAEEQLGEALKGADVVIIPAGVPRKPEVFKKAGTYDEKKLFGVTTLDVVRAKTFYAGKANIPVEDVNVPVVGGHAGITILPLFSQATPSTNALSDEDIKALMKRT